MTVFSSSPRAGGAVLPARRPLGWLATLGLVALLLTLAGPLPALAQHRPAAPAAGASAQTAPSLADALTPTGHLRPGATGSFDATGYRMLTDPATGAPTFQPNRPAGAGDENWRNSSTVPGVSGGNVNAVAVVGPKVYVGGVFTEAGGKANTARIACWDGTAWQALGTGISFGSVSAMAVAGPDLYVGGEFFNAGGNPNADGVARWDGTAWQALGTGINNNKVLALAVLGTDVYVGGGFQNAGGNSNADRIARWTGTTWQALGTGVNSTVYALAVAGPDLYVGGEFFNAGGNPNADRVARWDGTAWQALGTGINNNRVLALAVLGTDVYVGGNFENAGGNPNADWIVRWTGTAWQALGTGVNSTVYALAVAGPDLYVGGSFEDAGGNPNADQVARWDGTAWQALGTGVSGSAVTSLAVRGSDVYVGGGIYIAGGTVGANRVARWTGTAWQPLGTGLSDAVLVLAVAGPDLYVGGSFTSAGGKLNANGVARWTGTTWQALGTGIYGGVSALAVSGSNVYVGGTFEDAGGNPNADNIARWDGTAWQALGTGLGRTVYALAVSGSNVYVGGSFNDAGGNPNADNIARWDGTAWQALGTGLNNYVYALAVAGPDVYVGGTFTDAGGNPNADGVARWTGTAWQALGTGMNLASGRQVRALVVSGSNVYAGGSFIDAGGNPNADGVARWDGAAWQALGTGLNNAVLALAISGSDVYVGGNFTAAGGNPNADGVARWDGTAWQALGTGLNNVVFVLAVGPGNKLNAGGTFTTVGDGSKPLAYFGIYAPNAAPTAVALSNSSIVENTGANAVVGTLSTTDPDAGDTFTYTLVSGVNSSQNALVNISGNTLRITASPDYETRNTYSVRIRSTDAGGLFTEQIFLLSITDVAEAPTALMLSNTTLDENVPANTLVGTFSATDLGRPAPPTGGATGSGGSQPAAGPQSAQFTYALPANASYPDNAAFSISNNDELRINASPDFETKSSYSILARVTDYTNMSFEQAFTITITDVVEITSLTVSTVQTVPAGLYSSLTVTSTGVATLGGAITVDGPLVVQAGGELDDNCQIISGSGSFTLEADATLHVCNAAGISASGATGAIQVRGARSFAAGARYIYDGSAAQITGTGLSAARELVIANAAGVTLSQAVAVASVLRLSAGTFVTSGNLTLLSTATQQAIAIHAGGTTSGAVTVQRYITGPAAAGYRHLAAPVLSTSVADLATAGFTPKVNSAYNTLPVPVLSLASFPTVFGFDEARGGAANATFTDAYFSPASLAAPLANGLGYTVYIGGGHTPDFVGALATGDVTRAGLTRTGPLSNAKAGYHLLGNPYAQPIDWDLATIPAGLDPTIFVWYSTGGSNGAYRVRNGATSVGNLTDGLLALGQAFFARVTGAGPVDFTFENAMRVNANVALGRATASPAPLLHLNLTQVGAPASRADATFLTVAAAATADYDANLDALRPGRNVGVPTLATLVGGQEAAINALSEAVLTSATATTVELTAVLPAVGAYTLNVGALANWGTTSVELLDRLTNTRYDLATTPALTLTATRANEAVAGRFAVVLNGQRVLGTSDFSPLTAHLTVHPNPAAAGGSVHLTGCPGSLPVAVLDLAGRRVATVVADAAGEAVVSTTKLAAGTYVVRAADGRTTRLVVQ